MADRDVEKVHNKDSFISTLRRLADALEKGEAFRIQIVNQRFTIPADAQLSIEHEASGGEEEVELQLRWRSGA